MLKYDIRLYGKVKFQMEVNRWVNKRWAEKKSKKAKKQKDIIHNKNNAINLFNTSYLFKSTHNSMG